MCIRLRSSMDASIFPRLPDFAAIVGVVVAGFAVLGVVVAGFAMVGVVVAGFAMVGVVVITGLTTVSSSPPISLLPGDLTLTA